MSNVKQKYASPKIMKKTNKDGKKITCPSCGQEVNIHDYVDLKLNSFQIWIVTSVID